MFGMGFMEIFLIAIVAIIALGPDKLPTAMVEVAKFFKKFKSGVEDAKSTLDTELNISEMKAEANKFKAQIENVKSNVNIDTNVDLGLDDIMKNDLDSSENEKPTKTKSKKEKKKKAKVVEETKKVEVQKVEDLEVKEIDKSANNNAANKFKVNFDEDIKEDKV